jgi:sugar lactone lactonase YvrE
MSTENIQPVIESRMQLGECPVWHPREAALYWIDIDGCAVHRFHPDSRRHDSWPMPSQPGCIALRAAGGLLVALRSGLAVLDTQSGTLSEISPPPYEQATTRFNDGRCDAAGRLWVGSIYEPRDQPNAALFCVEHGAINDSGKRGTVLNGIAFSPDNRTFYHSDTTLHSIYTYNFDLASGDLSGGRLLKSFSRDKTQPDYGGRPDGATIDSEGAYWCAMYEGGRLLRLSTAGDILQEIALPVRCPTMMAFGGADLRTLYITTVSKGRSEAELSAYPLSGQLLSLRVDVAGRAEHAYEG